MKSPSRVWLLAIPWTAAYQAPLSVGFARQEYWSGVPRQCIKKHRLNLLTKVCIVKAMVFSVVMYRCENWIIKKAEHWKINVFKLWCWRRLLRVPWTAWKSSQSVNPKGNQPWVFIEWWSSNTLATWCEEPTHWKRPWCWERLKTKGERDCREGDG